MMSDVGRLIIMVRVFAHAALASLLLLLTPSPGNASKRFALLVANSIYQNAVGRKNSIREVIMRLADKRDEGLRAQVSR